MGKDKTKGIVIAVILLIAAGFVLQTTGILGSLESAITPKPCDEAPYASNCVCALDEERLSVKVFGFKDKYVCELEDKFIDPADVDWEAQVILYAEQVLSEEYPDCDMNTCSQGEWNTYIGWMDYERRIAMVECNVLDKSFATVRFFIDTGEIDIINCGDYEAPQEGQPYIDIWHSGYYANAPWLIAIRYEINCAEGTGTATGEYTHTLPESYSDVDRWYFHSGDQTVDIGGNLYTPKFGSCVLTDATVDSVTVSCTAECTGYSDYGGDLGVLRYE